MKILIVAGARPNFMKVAPLLRAIQQRASGVAVPPMTSILVHTGQHYDEKMSDVFFRELGIASPDVNLGVGSGTHAVQTANVMIKFEPVCAHYKPDYIVVVGDVNSTMACTLVASKLGIKVAHLEAGLRSFDRTMPEEINRIVTDSLADILLTPSTDADENLKKEGVPANRIKLVGNIMIDSLVANLKKARKSRIMVETNVKKRNFIYVTLHRPSNVDVPSNLQTIIKILRNLAKNIPIVFPVHPRTRKMITDLHSIAVDNPSFNILDPVGYHDSLCLTENARLVLTDSGGLQEESTYFQTPCLTLRPNTERPITIKIGSNQLTDPNRLLVDIEQALGGPECRGKIPPLWDGEAAKRTLDVLAASFN